MKKNAFWIIFNDVFQICQNFDCLKAKKENLKIVKIRKCQYLNRFDKTFDSWKKCSKAKIL